MIAAGLRVAAVSNVSIVSVASLIGVAQLGSLLTDGYQRFYGRPSSSSGSSPASLLALAFDVAHPRRDVAADPLAAGRRRAGCR